MVPVSYMTDTRRIILYKIEGIWTLEVEPMYVDKKDDPEYNFEENFKHMSQGLRRVADLLEAEGR